MREKEESIPRRTCTSIFLPCGGSGRIELFSVFVEIACTLAAGKIGRDEKENKTGTERGLKSNCHKKKSNRERREGKLIQFCESQSCNVLRLNRPWLGLPRESPRTVSISPTHALSSPGRTTLDLSDIPIPDELSILVQCCYATRHWAWPQIVVASEVELETHFAAGGRKKTTEKKTQHSRTCLTSFQPQFHCSFFGRPPHLSSSSF